MLLDSELQRVGSLAEIQKSHGATPELDVDPKTGQLQGTYVGMIHAARVHAATRLRGTPIANYTPPPGNTSAGFLEKLKKIPWWGWALGGVAVLALILGPKE